MLFAGDVCTNLMGLGDPAGFQNLGDGRASQRKRASLSFDAAGGHGGPIAQDASTQFREKWARNRLPGMGGVWLSLRAIRTNMQVSP
jgi:hypothetical protein